MLFKCLGVQQMNFTLDNGYHFEGRKVHGMDLDKKPEGLTGNMVTTFRLPADNPKLAVLDVRVGETYEVYFEQDGKTVAMLRKEISTVANNVK